MARREIARVYDASLRPARGDLERATREVLDAAHALHGATGHTRTGEEQRGWIIRTAAIGAAVGLLAFPLLAFPLARFLPFGNLPDGLAASALGQDRWNAGMGLMSRANPEKWNGFVADYTMVRATAGELKTCFDSAQKAGKEQRCFIAIRPAPAPSPVTLLLFMASLIRLGVVSVLSLQLRRVWRDRAATKARSPRQLDAEGSQHDQGQAEPLNRLQCFSEREPIDKD